LLIVILMLSALVLFARRTDALTNPQFWAEDGTGWFMTAHNHNYSIPTLITPYSGYMQIFPRAVAVFSGVAGLGRTPLIFNLSALAIQLLPIFYIWSKRFNSISPNTLFKIFLTITYLALPYTDEIHANITNSQWHLSVVGFIIIFLPRLKHKVLNYAELALLTLICLSGPFVFFLLFAYLLNKFIQKEKKKWDVVLFIFVITSTIQAFVYLLTVSDRQTEKVGYSLTQLFYVISGQVVGGGLFGHAATKTFTSSLWLAYIVSILFIAIFSIL
jgi:hypothetical protein